MSIVVSTGEIGAGAIGALGRRALDGGGDAELFVARVAGEARVLGAFEAGRAGHVRRMSGGPTVLAGEGTVHVLLSLARPDVLVADATPRNIVNRYVRPLLRGLTKAGKLAHHFGRDWIAVAHRPAAWVGFAHDAASQRTVLEAFVAVTTPFAADPGRATFLGKEPTTLGSNPALIVEAIARAYADAFGGAVQAAWAPPDADVPLAADDAPWDRTVDEAIGILGVRRDAAGVALGGELMVSRDAFALLAADAARGPVTLDVVESRLAREDVAIEGVRSLESFVTLLA